MIESLSPLRAAFPLVAALALAAAGCRGEPPAEPASSQVPTGAAIALPEACDLLTQREAAASLGEEAAPSAGNRHEPRLSRCHYEAPGGERVVGITVMALDPAIIDYRALSAEELGGRVASTLGGDAELVASAPEPGAGTLTLVGTNATHVWLNTGIALRKEGLPGSGRNECFVNSVVRGFEDSQEARDAAQRVARQVQEKLEDRV